MCNVRATVETSVDSGCDCCCLSLVALVVLLSVVVHPYLGLLLFGMDMDTLKWMSDSLKWAQPTNHLLHFALWTSSLVHRLSFPGISSSLGSHSQMRLRGQVLLLCIPASSLHGISDENTGVSCVFFSRGSFSRTELYVSHLRQILCWALRLLKLYFYF